MKNKHKQVQESKEVNSFTDVKFYYGEFTDKMVKPIGPNNRFNDFKNGDDVIVLNYGDYQQFREEALLLIRDVKKALRDCNGLDPNL